MTMPLSFHLLIFCKISGKFNKENYSCFLNCSLPMGFYNTCKAYEHKNQMEKRTSFHIVCVCVRTCVTDLWKLNYFRAFEALSFWMISASPGWITRAHLWYGFWWMASITKTRKISLITLHMWGRAPINAFSNSISRTLAVLRTRMISKKWKQIVEVPFT